ncbi:DUF58 domain-containing protein [Polymorphobacter sp. PAMC 29334]|uniref:DUF58 domain-containing protein n=1 Tax=Polymorphobacter sp. PAMC 29334 TaxID=2862331 RepID=UPI001C6730DB|nr:DUF58 domain-containing protein [Polymorphobacter sp. PAMC 29334]QYE34577.1 DUF58 domain-containing protein [Polymorphobacter sp. PAMC 29334]
MIYPTRRLVLAAALGAPVALLVGILAPALWLLPLGWVLLLLLLAAADVAAAVTPGTLTLAAPVSVGVGERFGLPLSLSQPHSRRAEASVGGDARLDLGGGRSRLAAGATVSETALIPATALRRGIAMLGELTLRWQGPLGLVWRQRATRLDRSVLVTPDVRSVRGESVALLSREARTGSTVWRETGQGGEFDALAQYQPGMDRRRIDWKASARHSALFAKEYRAERDNNIVLAFDCGRTMVEPVAGVARLDRAISAGLLIAYLSLKLGDRVTLFGFDSRPRLASAALTGTPAFADVRRLAGRLDCSSDETNFTLGLSTLAARLERRSLIILFTDFTDAISAELMLRSVGRLLERHVLLCVVLNHEVLEALVAAEPLTADDVTRAVIAADLLRERRIVLTRLRRMGVEVLEASWRDLGPALAERYLDARRRRLR